MSVIVKNQKELDKALLAKEDLIYIESPAGVWLYLGKEGIPTGSSTVVARGSSTVVARGSSTVEARGSSTVVARESSTVVARGSSRVEAWESSTVVARGSSTVEARGSSRVEAWESSTVVAWESSRVVAWESSTVVARGSSTVEARGSSRVEASKYVAIHLHSAKAKIEGGVLIDLTKIDLTNNREWLEYHGVEIDGDGNAILYKAVNDQFQTNRGAEWTYSPDSTVVAKDFEPTNKCGQGLHFGITPRHSKAFFEEATRFVAVKVKVDGLIPLDDKCKVANCKVLYEVDIWGVKK